MNDAAQYLKSDDDIIITDSAKETYVAFVLDESGSMSGKEQTVIGGFNEHLNVLRNRQTESGDTKVALFKFGSPPDSRPRRLFRGKSPDEIRELSRGNYNPSGVTPLNDAVGMAINDLVQYDTQDGTNRAFLVIVLTDGQENASREFTGSQIADRISSLQATGRWTITFVGAQFNPRDLAATRDLSVGNMAKTASVEEAMWRSTSALDDYMTTVRGSGQTYTANYYSPSKSKTDDDARWVDSKTTGE